MFEVEDELQVLDAATVLATDLDAWAQYREEVLDHTLFRHVKRTRGRLVGFDDAFCESRDQASLPLTIH